MGIPGRHEITFIYVYNAQPHSLRIIFLLWERNHLFELTWRLKCIELFCWRFFFHTKVSFSFKTVGVKFCNVIILILLFFSVYDVRYNFFISNPIFELSLELLYQKSQNEAQSCYEVAKYFWNPGSRLLSCLILGSNVWKNKQKLAKLTEVAKNF